MLQTQTLMEQQNNISKNMESGKFNTSFYAHSLHGTTRNMRIIW